MNNISLSREIFAYKLKERLASQSIQLSTKSFLSNTPEELVDSCLGVTSINTSKPEEEKYLLSGSQIVPIGSYSDSHLTRRLREDIKSMYVRDFISADQEQYEFFKNLLKQIQQDESIRMLEQNQQQCKYIHLILDNPENDQQVYEVGCKVFDIRMKHKYQ